MNPQPHPIVGQFGVLIFALLVAYISLTGNKKRPKQASDGFVVGYIYDNTFYSTHDVEQDNIIHNKRSSPQKKKIYPASHVKTKETAQQTVADSQAVKPKEQVIDEALFNDCMLALISLGLKKSESKIVTKKVFDEHQPKTIEEFIKFVYLKT